MYKENKGDKTKEEKSRTTTTLDDPPGTYNYFVSSHNFVVFGVECVAEFFFCFSLKCRFSMFYTRLLARHQMLLFLVFYEYKYVS